MPWFDRRSKPKNDKHQLREILNKLERLERSMSQEFDNLKVAVENARVAIIAAVEKMGQADSPAEIQAEAEKLQAAVDSLVAATNPTPPTP